MKIIAMLVAACCLASCASTPSRVAYDHATATQSQMIAERFECAQKSMGFIGIEGSGAAMPNAALMRNCMAAKGYTNNGESGRLAVPDELRMRTY